MRFMVNPIILSSSLRITIIVQNWTSDNHGYFFEALVKKGYTVANPDPTQVMQGQLVPLARKGTTSALTIDHQNRSILFQITNENNSPNKNIEEILEILSSIGFPSQESVERIDIQGNVIIKLQDGKASSLVTRVVNNNFMKNVGTIFGRQIKPIGLRISSEEPWSAGSSKSPFVILMEPLFVDDSDTKILANLTCYSGNAQYVLDFAQNLYERLKNIIIELQK